jgi:hypothetical protein
VADPGYPHGKARNRSLPGDSDGTPWEEDLVNDIWGLLQSLLAQVGITPTGTPDEVGASQYLQALREMRTESHVSNWRADVHDSGAGAVAADRRMVFWSSVLVRFLAAASTAPVVRIASRALDWSTPGTPPVAAMCSFAENATRVVGGSEADGCWYTDDGDEWIAATGDGGTIVHYGAADAIFMASARDGVVETSADGAAFSAAGSVGAMTGQTAVSVRALACNSTGRWVVVGVGDGGLGDAALIKYSDNEGATWTEAASTTEPTNSNSALSVVWNERLGLFVMCGANWRIATSPNGSDWTDRLIHDGTPGGGFYHAMTVDDLLVVSGTQGVLFTSYDGIAWERRSTGDITLHPSGTGGSTTLASSPYGIIGHDVNALQR